MRKASLRITTKSGTEITVTVTVENHVMADMAKIGNLINEWCEEGDTLESIVFYDVENK